MEIRQCERARGRADLTNPRSLRDRRGVYKIDTRTRPSGRRSRVPFRLRTLWSKVRRPLLLAALVVAAALAGRAGASESPVIFGYPYAASCPGAGFADVVDRWHMFACNCTSYVAWALSANGQRTDWFIPGSMDAWNWPNVARLAHLRVDAQPAVGAVAVWPHLARPLGHVAYVTGVDARRLIDVAEYNLPLFGRAFVFDTRPDVPLSGAVFIHVPRRERPLR